MGPHAVGRRRVLDQEDLQGCLRSPVLAQPEKDRAVFHVIRRLLAQPECGLLPEFQRRRAVAFLLETIGGRLGFHEFQSLIDLGRLADQGGEDHDRRKGHGGCLSPVSNGYKASRSITNIVGSASVSIGFFENPSIDQSFLGFPPCHSWYPWSPLPRGFSMRNSNRRATFSALVLSISFQLVGHRCVAQDLPGIDPTALPPRSVPELLPPRPVPEWTRTHFRVGHLPGSPAMADEFVKAGYNVVMLNALGRWDVVGPSARCIRPETRQGGRSVPAHARRKLPRGRGQGDLLHRPGAGAGRQPDVREGPSRTGCASGPTASRTRPPISPTSAAATPTGCSSSSPTSRAKFKADGYWFDGYAPAAPAHLRRGDEEGVPRVLRRPGDPAAAGGRAGPVACSSTRSRSGRRRYLAWHEDYFVKLRRPDARGHPQGEPGGGHLRQPLGQPHLVLIPTCTWASTRSTTPAPSISRRSSCTGTCPAIRSTSSSSTPSCRGSRTSAGRRCWIQPSAHGISGMSSPVEIQLRGLEGTPWGVIPEFVESTGREEYFKLHLANMKAREEWFEKSEAVPYLGIVASEQTRTLYAQRRLPVYFSHTLGAFRAFLEKHVPVRVLTEHDLEDAEPAGRPRAGAAERRLHVAAGGRGGAAVRQGRRRAGRHVRDVAVRRRTIRSAPTSPWPTCSGRSTSARTRVSQRIENLSLTLDGDAPDRRTTR